MPARPRWTRVAWVAVLAVGITPSPGRAENPLIDAVRAGRLDTVRTLIAEGADVNVGAVDGTTALHWAVHQDDTDLAALLIGAGADVTAVNRYDVAPLALACTNGSVAMIARLLAAGADANGRLPEGETALMTAARTGRDAAVRLLIDHGADVNAAEAWRGQTALMWAAAEGHTAVIRTLIDYGADIAARSERSPPAEPTEGWSAFLFAVRGAHLPAARVLADAGADINDTAPGGTSALLVAVDNRNYELAAWLLNQGADPNDARVGWTALHAAVLAHRPHFRVVPYPQPTGNLDSFSLLEALLEHGADPNAPTSKLLQLAEQASPLFDRLGVTPFLLAAIAADVPVMRLMLEHGADPRVTTPAGSTALMAAAGAATYQWQSPGSEAEALDAVRLLLDLGVDATTVDQAGNTALHAAANRGAHTIIELLLAHGARLDAVNDQGWMPVTIAQGPHTFIEPYPETHVFLLERMVEAGLKPPPCPACVIPDPPDASR